jgi:4-hydroxy-tetrahydrodipicolinate synthase
MMQSDDLKGVIPAVVTPFHEDGELDRGGLSRLTDFLLDKGVHGIMTTGGNGEFPHLSREEKRVVTETVVKAAKGKAPVIAGTAACSTRETLVLSKDAEEAGADAVIVTPPYFYRLPEASLYEHYRQLTEALALPVVPYNNPLYTGHNLHPELIERLAGLRGIIGLKQSNADLGQLVESIRRSGDKISICTGIDTQFYPSLCAGARGIFSTAACVIPEHMVEIYDHFQAGNSEEAFTVHARIQELNTLFEYDPGYVAPCKEALRLLGLPGGPVREPLPALTPEELKTLRAALENLGLL